jgi:dipeptidyl aminopeptidase/acylaminoacyl peptidase
MKRITTILNLLVLCLFIVSNLEAQVERREIGNLVIEEIPDIPKDISDRMQQYQNARSARFNGWDAEGNGMFVVTRFAETRQVHYVSIKGGSRKQLTFFKEPVSGIGVRPYAPEPGFLFSKDIGGNEMYQIYYYDMKDGSYQMLTDGKSRNSSFVWSEKGEAFAFVSNKRNGRDFDIYITNMKNPKQAKLIYESKGYWGPIEWSPDGKQLLIYNYISINESSIYILDINSGKITPFQKSKDKLAMGSALWSSDGKGIYFTSDNESEFQRLQYYDLSKVSIEVISKDILWNVEELIQSKDGKWLAFIVNENGSGKLYLLNTITKKVHSPKSIPPGLVSGGEFNPDGKRLGFTFNGSKTAGDVFVLDVNKDKLKRWTYSEVGGLNTDEFVDPKLIAYTTFDKVDGKPRMIPAYYYKPKGKGPFPVVIYFHGGPEAQFKPGFISTFQFWLNELGIAVIAPNVRGSAGYGKSYLLLDNGFNRENSVKDGGALLDWIVKQPELDSKKIAVFGGSYGGYMVLAMMTNYNDRLAAGIDIVGISNFVTFLKNTGEYRRDLRRAEYGDERDPKMHDYLIKISPTTNAHKITKPMLIVQGLNDPRVPVTEAEQMVEVVRKNSGLAWYLLAKDEGHGFAKKVNRDYYRNAVALFLKTFLVK